VLVSSAELTCGKFISTGTSTLIEKVGGVSTGYDTFILIDESPRVGVLSSAFDGITGTQIEGVVVPKLGGPRISKLGEAGT